MNNTKYIFEPEKGKIYDLFTSLSLSTMYERLESRYSMGEYLVSKDISKSYSRIYSFIKENSVGLNLFFFSQKDGENFFQKKFKDELLRFSSIEEITERLKREEPEDLVVELLSFYDSKNDFSEYLYKSIVSNKQQFKDFLNGLKLSSEIKWDFTNFVDSPGETVNKLVDFLLSAYKEIEAEYKLNDKILKEYYAKIKADFDSQKEEFLSGKTSLYDDLKDELDFDTIHFIITMFPPFTIQYLYNNRELNVYLGYGFENKLYVQTKVKPSEPKMFKAFSDKTRFKILQMVSEREYYANEIGSSLGVPMSSLSHHLEILSSSGIVSKRNQGKKAYFKLDPDATNDAIQILRKLVSNSIL